MREKQEKGREKDSREKCEEEREALTPEEVSHKTKMTLQMCLCERYTKPNKVLQHPCDANIRVIVPEAA